MTDYLLLFVGTVLVNNFVLVKFLAFVPLWAYPKTGNRHGMASRRPFVMTLASICAWLIDTGYLFR